MYLRIWQLAITYLQVYSDELTQKLCSTNPNTYVSRRRKIHLNQSQTESLELEEIAMLPSYQARHDHMKNVYNNYAWEYPKYTDATAIHIGSIRKKSLHISTSVKFTKNMCLYL